MKQWNHSDWLFEIDPVSEEWIKKAKKRLDNLVKPKDSLGMLEEIAARIIGIKRQERISLDKRAIFVFAADHGVAEEGISAYPQEVTYLMVKNFLKGIAAINVLARHARAIVYVVDIGVKSDIEEDSPYLLKRKIKKGTDNIIKAPAMSLEEAKKAIITGIEIADMAKENGMDIIATGDMGIGNTTPAAAIYCTLFDCKPEEVVGKGTGIDNMVLKKKIDVVKKAIEVNRDLIKDKDPLKILASVGGLEIAGICGLCLGGAKNRIAVLVDGFIACAGALIAMELRPAVKDYLFFCHMSAEKGHRLFFEKIKEKPILKLNMKLGEGTGATLAMHIIDAAIRIYNEMATFEEAGIKPGHR